MTDPATRAARAGLGDPGDAGGTDLVPPMSLASVGAFADLDSLDAGMETRAAYRRYGNSAAARLEEVIADLETPPGAKPPLARATASGLAGLALALTLFAAPGRRRVVVVRPCYGSIDALVSGPLGNLGLDLTTVDLDPGGGDDHGALVAGVLGTDVAAVVVEIITNPLCQVVDVPAIAEASRAAGTACIVDSTLATPFLFQPLAHGADVVLHSLTKHLSGHSDVLGGIVLVNDAVAEAGYLDGFSRLLGAVLAPFDAWLALRGLRTAALRVERCTENAAALCEFFAARPEVAAVHYPGRGDAAERQRCARLLPRGRGPMLSIELAGGRDAVASVCRSLGEIRIAPSLGDVATTVSHPALTSHRSLSPERRAALGISDGLLRISTGIEHIDDLRTEFDSALRTVTALG